MHSSRRAAAFVLSFLHVPGKHAVLDHSGDFTFVIVVWVPVLVAVAVVRSLSLASVHVNFKFEQFNDYK